MSSRLVILIGSMGAKVYAVLAKVVNTKEGLQSHLTGIGDEDQ
jgi:hypothetical protein